MIGEELHDPTKMAKQGKRKLAEDGATATAKKHKASDEEGEDVDMHTLGFGDALSVGLAFQQLESHDSAREAFERAIALKPAHYGARLRLADVCSESSAFADAVVHYCKAATCDEATKDASLWLRLGMALAATDAVDDALESYRKAARIAESEVESSEDAKRTYGMALAATANSLGMDKGDINGAVQVYKDAVAKFPRNANLYFNLATMQLASEEKRAAVASFKSAIELDGEVVEFYEELLGCLDDKKEVATYTEKLNELRKRQPTAEQEGGDDEDEDEEEESKQEEEEQDEDDDSEEEEEDDSDEDDEDDSDV